jgi:uncharacterized protein HemY
MPFNLTEFSTELTCLEAKEVKVYIYLRLGDLYLRTNDFGEAKDTYLQLCKLSPSAYVWTGVGIASYRMEDYPEAEAAFAVRKQFEFVTATKNFTFRKPIY